MITTHDIAQAVALAWTTEKNCRKSMDVDIAEAIIDNIVKLISREDTYLEGIKRDEELARRFLYPGDPNYRPIDMTEMRRKASLRVVNQKEWDKSLGDNPCSEIELPVLGPAEHRGMSPDYYKALSERFVKPDHIVEGPCTQT